MNRKQREWLEAALDGAPQDAATGRAEGLQGRLEEERALRAAIFHDVRQQAARVHDPFLADRVMRSLQHAASPAAELASALLPVFRRVAIAGLLLVVALLSYNLFTAPVREPGRTAVERALALPPLTLQTADELELADNLEMDAL